jgi:single-stranded DNA-binding protein
MKPERNLQKSTERGLGVRWSQNQSGRPQTQLAVICYLKVLMDAGHYEPVKLAINGQMGDYVLKALVEHIRFLQNADKLRKNENPLLPYQAGVELKAGGDADFGKGDTVTTMTVLVAGHPQPRDLTLDYVNAMLMPEAHQEIIDLSVEENWERVLEFVAGFNAARDEENGNDNGNGNGNAPKSDALGGGHTGRIGFEPEMRFTAQGNPFTKWSIFDEEMGGWANCIAWGSLAEKVNDASLSKGDVITVHGFWKENQYTDKETGEAKTSRTLNAKKVQVGDEIFIPDSENGVKIEPVPPVPSGSEDNNIPF